MQVRLVKKSGHKFFEFTDSGVSRTVCVDGWINSKICPSFCQPVLVEGWKALPDDRLLDVVPSMFSYTILCPTSFGYISSRGAYRNTGAFHMNLVLDCVGLSQYLYNYVNL